MVCLGNPRADAWPTGRLCLYPDSPGAVTPAAQPSRERPHASTLATLGVPARQSLPRAGLLAQEDTPGQHDQTPRPHLPRRTHHLSCSEDRTTDTEEAAMAAEPIHGCSTMPKGMKTPAGGGGSSQRGPEQAEGGPGCPLHSPSPSTWVTTVSPQTPEGPSRNRAVGILSGLRSPTCPDLPGITHTRFGGAPGSRDPERQGGQWEHSRRHREG